MSIEQRLDELFADYVQEQQYSGTVLVAQHGQVILSGAYGWANREHAVPNRPDTKFRIASISKSFTAMGILWLAERGKLDLGDSVRRYFTCPWLPVKATLHHLMTHTSGIPDFEKLPAFANGEERSLLRTEDMLALIKDVPLLFEPGKGWSYGNTGYNLLASLIERISEQSYGEFLRSVILEPLGMTSTGSAYSQSIVSGLADGYTKDEAGVLTKARYYEIHNFQGSGSLYSTAEDLLLWDRALYANPIVSGDALARMFRRHAEASPRRHYGYGWSVYDRFRGHGGWLPGCWSKFRQYPEQGLALIMLSNHDFTAENEILDRTGEIALTS
ncbi:beta-lactamase family protein [Paenibacillus doosanensis]|uniref:serine hydrolase domain-containing protein n=1 Tax=Paenibacillus doosanensis TaxID=1229154 RepID=UPI00217F7D41|nr:serine hydrolase domain-containing protein [Paenibacillus doosanensis]MCS7464822.1 beta-lactamase family protein [Paenibacillus doosanensis]